MTKQSEHLLPSILSRTKLEEGKTSKFKRRNNDLIDRLNELDQQVNIFTRLIKNFEPDRILLVKDVIEIVAKIKIDLIESFVTLDKEMSQNRWNGSSVSSTSSHLSNISSELSIASNESSLLKAEEIAKINLNYKSQIESFLYSVKYDNISVQEMMGVEKEASDLLRIACLHFANHARNGSIEKNTYREYAFKLADISILLNKQILEQMRLQDDIELELKELEFHKEELEFHKLEITTEESVKRDKVLEEELTLFCETQQKEITAKEEKVRHDIQKQKAEEYKPLYQYGYEIQRDLIAEKENQLRIKLNEEYAAWYSPVSQEKQNISREIFKKREETGRIDVARNESFEREMLKCQELEIMERNKLVGIEHSTRTEQVANFNEYNKALLVLKTDKENLAKERQRLDQLEAERQRLVAAEKLQREREETERQRLAAAEKLRREREKEEALRQAAVVPPAPTVSKLKKLFG